MSHFRDGESEKENVGPPTIENWENARAFVRFLSTFYNVTLRFNASI